MGFKIQVATSILQTGHITRTLFCGHRNTSPPSQQTPVTISTSKTLAAKFIPRSIFTPRDTCSSALHRHNKRPVHHQIRLRHVCVSAPSSLRWSSLAFSGAFRFAGKCLSRLFVATGFLGRLEAVWPGVYLRCVSREWDTREMWRGRVGVGFCKGMSCV